MTGRSPPAADGRLLFGLLSLLLALSLVMHQLWWEGFEVRSLHFVVILGALWAAARPTSVPRFLAMLGAEVVSVTLDMPGVGSHMLLLGVCGACVLAYAAAVAVPARRLPDAGVLFAGIAPFLRVSVLVLYVAAALAKMNGGFFDSAVSCAGPLTAQIAWFDPALLGASWLELPAIWGTVIIEAALPVLLAVRRTRMVGVLLGTGFHLVLAFAGNVPFSSLMLALYVAFLPLDAPSRVRAVVARRPWAPRPGWVAPLAFVAAVAAWLLGAALAPGETSFSSPWIATGTRLAFAGVVLALAGTGLAARRVPSRPAGHAPRSARLGHPIFAAGVLVLVFNAMSPYLGLKTESSFAMFSNLHTEAGYWNHAFIPEAVRVFGYQDELVSVTASNDPVLVRRSRDGARLVRFELERYLRLNPGARVRTAPAIGAVEPGLGVIDRIAKFRDVRAPERIGC